MANTKKGSPWGTAGKVATHVGGGAALGYLAGRGVYGTMYPAAVRVLGATSKRATRQAFARSGARYTHAGSKTLGRAGAKWGAVFGPSYGMTMMGTNKTGRSGKKKDRWYDAPLLAGYVGSGLAQEAGERFGARRIAGRVLNAQGRAAATSQMLPVLVERAGVRGLALGAGLGLGYEAGKRVYRRMARRRRGR